MRVRCSLKELKDELGLSVSELAEALGIDWRTIEKLLSEGGEPWRLDRDKLYKLILFAHEHGYKAFCVEPHPIWKTFEESEDEIVFFRGSNPMDAPVEDHLRQYCEHLGAMTRSTTVPDGLEEAMKNNNCVIIGSPKLNRASEMAFSLLWGATPFDSDPSNQERIPVHFLRMDLDSLAKSALLIKSPRCGLHISVPGVRGRRFLKVDWLPREKHEVSTQSGQEAAVLVACYRPLGTSREVTTVIIAGYTGLSTLEAAREATYRQIPNLSPGVTPGDPQFAILKFQYRKRAKRTKSQQGLRSPKPETARWAPEWEDFFDNTP